MAKTNNYSRFTETVGRGNSFGNEEVKRALAAGYTLDDVNGYLKYSGITPKGDFAVAGYNERKVRSWGTKDSGSVGPSISKDPYYRFVGSAAPAAPTAPAPRPAEPTDPTAPTVSNPTTTPINPELAIPTDSIRLLGENLGIKAKRSSAQKSNLTSKGTGRLTIPRSSGYQPLNMGM